MATAIVAMDIV